MATATIQDVDADVDAEHPSANQLRSPGSCMRAAPPSFSADRTGSCILSGNCRKKIPGAMCQFYMDPGVFNFDYIMLSTFYSSLLSLRDFF